MKIIVKVDYGTCTEILKTFDTEESYAAELAELELLCLNLGGYLIESIEF